MQGDAQVISCLQAQLRNHLIGINQYFVHYRMYRHWGFEQLAQCEYKDSIREMKHADHLMERIFMLDGLPNLQDLGKLRIGEDVPEALDCDLYQARASQATLKKGIAQCEQVKDFVSRDTLRKILDCTEDQIDTLETQLALIEKIGLQKYLQEQMGD